MTMRLGALVIGRRLRIRTRKVRDFNGTNDLNGEGEWEKR